MDALDVQIELMRAAGLTDDDVIRLCLLREHIQTGACHDDTIEHRRAMFARYLAIKAGRYLED